MRKIILFVALLLAINIVSTQNIFASEAGSSAKLQMPPQKGSNQSDARVLALQNIFKKYDSDLVPYAGLYVKYADKYGVDWKLLPAISGLESGFGKQYLGGTYNAYGWGGGYIYFENWEDGIITINKALKENYINKGADDVYKIGPIYAESPTWSVRVARFMNEINEEYIKIMSSDLAFKLN